MLEKQFILVVAGIKEGEGEIKGVEGGGEERREGGVINLCKTKDY